MDERAILLILVVIIFCLSLVILYQWCVFRRGIQAELRKVNAKLKEIAETGSDEKVMIFTDNSVLMELGAQINRLLTEWQKTKADFEREKNCSKRMLSNISHDMKTPLTVILGYLEIMRLARTDDEMLQKTEAKAEQVLEMMNEFFTLAKLEAGDSDIEVGKVNICEVCRETVLEFYELLHQREFQVELDIPEAFVFVQGENRALQRILYNLISNVIRYGSAGKYLGIFLRQNKGCVYIDVVDRGKGISKEWISRVFDRLYTMEDSRNREIQGNGLGLAIARNLAVRLGGSLYVESIPGVRTVFTLELQEIDNAVRDERNS